MMVRLLCVCGLYVMATGAIQLSAADSDLALEDLRAANQARKAAADEKMAWETESQRLSLLISESKRQQEQLRTAQQRNQKAVDQFQERLAQLDSQESQMLALDAMLLDLSKEIDTGLDKRLLLLPSSSVAEKSESAADAAMQFMRSGARLDQALNNSKHWQVSLSEGSLDGKPIVYDQLRMGNVCAWWASRDGQRAGYVNREEGKNRLTKIEDSLQVAHIVEAIAIVRGDRSPRLLSLPFQGITLSVAEKNKLGNGDAGGVSK